MKEMTVREERPGYWGPALICSVRGCGRTTYGGRDGMCADCTAMDEELDQYFEEKQKVRRQQIAARLGNIAWLIAFSALFAAVLYEFWPYLWAIYQLWFGGE